MVALLGRNGARGFYGLLGSVLSVVGLLSILGVVDLAESGRDGGSQSQSTVMAEGVDVPFADFVEDAAAAERLGEFVHFPRANARIRQPVGFELGGPSFEGFQHKESQTRVFIHILPSPYSTTTAKLMSSEAYSSKGQKFRGRQQTIQDGRKSLLSLGERPGLGGLNVVWMRNVEVGDKTLIVMAEIPKAAEAEFSAMLKAAILSAESEGP